MALIDKLKAIGNAIRAKTGGTEELTLDQMVTEIEGIEGGSGGDAGWVVCEETAPTSETTIDKLNGLRLSLPNAKWIGDSAFYACDNLVSVDLPAAHKIGVTAFADCANLKTVKTSAYDFDGEVFRGCTSLEKADIFGGGVFKGSTFAQCPKLSTVIIRSTEATGTFSAMEIIDTNIVTADGVPTGEGFVYVSTNQYEYHIERNKQLLISAGYDAATAEYAAKAVFRKIEDYPEICG